MKNRLIYSPVVALMIHHLLTTGFRLPSVWLWLLLAWIWAGVRITDRELGGRFWSVFFFSWLWPLLILKQGLFASNNYQVYLNDVPIGVASRQLLNDLYRDAVTDPKLYAEQATSLIASLAVSILVLGITGSAVVMWVAVGLGHYDGELLVEIVRTWAQTGSVPFQAEFERLAKGVLVGLFVFFARDLFSDKISRDLRVHFGAPAAGRVVLRQKP